MFAGNVFAMALSGISKKREENLLGAEDLVSAHGENPCVSTSCFISRVSSFTVSVIVLSVFATITLRFIFLPYSQTALESHCCHFEDYLTEHTERYAHCNHLVIGRWTESLKITSEDRYATRHRNCCKMCSSPNSIERIQKL